VTTKPCPARVAAAYKSGSDTLPSQRLTDAAWGVVHAADALKTAVKKLNGIADPEMLRAEAQLADAANEWEAQGNRGTDFYNKDPKGKRLNENLRVIEWAFETSDRSRANMIYEYTQNAQDEALQLTKEIKRVSGISKDLFR
jgi:hypothetical protein